MKRLSEVRESWYWFSSMGPVMSRISSMVERGRVMRRSGEISLPLSKNQRMVVAAVGKSGSQSESRRRNQPWRKACWMGSGGST